MKRASFNIADEEFMVLLERANTSFGKKGIRHMFVGGTANQIHVSRYLCDIYNKDLLDIGELSDVPLSDYLRATDDVDIALRIPYTEGDSADEEKYLGAEDVSAASKIFGVLDDIVGDSEYISPSENHVVTLDLIRKGHVRPKFVLGKDGEKYTDREVSFNIYRGPKCLKKLDLAGFEEKFYDVFLDRAVDVNIPYSSDRDITLRVKRAEDHLATKIVRGRPKDVSDALSISRYAQMARRPISYELVEEVLFSNNSRKERDDSAFADRYDAFRKLEGTLEGESGLID